MECRIMRISGSARDTKVWKNRLRRNEKMRRRLYRSVRKFTGAKRSGAGKIARLGYLAKNFAETGKASLTDT